MASEEGLVEYFTVALPDVLENPLVAPVTVDVPSVMSELAFVDGFVEFWKVALAVFSVVFELAFEASMDESLLFPLISKDRLTEGFVEFS